MQEAVEEDRQKRVSTEREKLAEEAAAVGKDVMVGRVTGRKKAKNGGRALRRNQVPG